PLAGRKGHTTTGRRVRPDRRDAVAGRLPTRTDLQPARDGAESDGQQEDYPGDDVDDSALVAGRVEPVRDRREHERAEESGPHLAAAAGEADAADHRGR